MNFGDRPIFEFTVPGPALSAQAKNRQRLRIWRETIADQARRALVDRPILIDELELRLTEFSEHRRSDRDNIAKPIQDAMEGILYANDRQVTRIKVEWCDIDGRYR